MFNSQPLSVVIGLVFIYLIYSLLGSLIQEIIATNLQLRNFVLKKAIRKMLDDGAPVKERSFSKLFFKHPLIKALAAENWVSRSPSYIKSETFSKVVLDLLRGKTIMTADTSKTVITNSITTATLAWSDGEETPVVIEGDTKDYMQSIWVDASGDVSVFRQLLEQWFNEMMDRATGWYKKRTQYLLFVIGFTIAIIFNVDTIKIAGKLHDSPALQEKVVVMAGDYMDKHPEAAEKAIRTTINADVNDQESKRFDVALYKRAGEVLDNGTKGVNNLLGLGWDTDGTFSWKNIWDGIAGWVLTALAISFGAPFWFDLLNKLMQFRGAVATKKSDEEKPAKP